MAAAPGNQQAGDADNCPSLEALFDDALPRI